MFGKEIARVFLISCLIAHLLCVENASAVTITRFMKSTASTRITTKSVLTKAAEKTITSHLRITTEPRMKITNING